MHRTEIVKGGSQNNHNILVSGDSRDNGDNHVGHNTATAAPSTGLDIPNSRY